MCAGVHVYMCACVCECMLNLCLKVEHFNLHALLGTNYTFFDFDLVLKLLFDNKQIHILFHEIFIVKDPLSYNFDTQSLSRINE